MPDRASAIILLEVTARLMERTGLAEADVWPDEADVLLDEHPETGEEPTQA